MGQGAKLRQHCAEMALNDALDSLADEEQGVYIAVLGAWSGSDWTGGRRLINRSIFVTERHFFSLAWRGCRCAGSKSQLRVFGSWGVECISACLEASGLLCYFLVVLRSPLK